MAGGSYDANGIWQYGPDDPRTPFHSTLNMLAASVSAAVAALKSRALALENANVLSAVGSPCVAASGWTISSQTGRKRNGTAWINLTLTRTGVAIAANATTGDITDIAMATFAAGWAPASGMAYIAASTAELGSFYLTNTEVRAAARLPGRNINTSDTIAITASYPLA